MSSLRVTSASRSVEPGRPTATAQADTSATSFPEALGNAVNPAEMTQAGHDRSAKTHTRQENATEEDTTAESAAGPTGKSAAATAKDANLPSQHRRSHSSGLGASEHHGGAAIATTALSGIVQGSAAQVTRPTDGRPKDSTSLGDRGVARDEAAGGSAAGPTRKPLAEAVNQPASGDPAPRDLPSHTDHDFVVAPSAATTDLSPAESSAVSTAENQAGIGSEGPRATGSPGNASTVPRPNSVADPSIDQLRVGLSADSGNSADRGTAPSSANAMRHLDLPGGGARPVIAHTSFAQLASTGSADRGQGTAPDDAATTVAAPLTVASASGDIAGSTDPDISNLGRPISDRSELDPSSDIFGQPLITAAWPTSAGDAVRAPLGSASRNSGGHSRSIAPNLIAEVQISDARNIVSGGLPAEAFSPSSESGLWPTDLSAQLFHHVMGSVDNGGQEVVLQLHPPELGDLTVRVLVHGREVSAWFATPQIQVQQAISQAIEQLQADLGNLGYYLANASVGADASSAGEPDDGSLMPQVRGAVDKSSPEKSSGDPSLSAATDVSVYV